MNGVTSAQAAYTTLGLRFGAPSEDVRGAYRTLLRRYHPDTGPPEPDAARRLAEVRAAYARLRPRDRPTDGATVARALDAYLPPPPGPTLDVIA
jgi:curved DNA-binding protein CbpA